MKMCFSRKSFLNNPYFWHRLWETRTCRLNKMTERDIIGIFGTMNAGKSSLMNLITQQESSIVDETPGTTAVRVFLCLKSEHL